MKEGKLPIPAAGHGLSGDIARRLLEHLRFGKLLAADWGSIRTSEVLGGKTAREVAEQVRIYELGGIRSGMLENMVNPIGASRRYLLQGLWPR